MKRLLIAAAILFVGMDVGATPVVNNSGSSSEDSLTVNVLNLWPNGDPANELDSLYFYVFKSGTNGAVFQDSSSAGCTMTGVDSLGIGLYYFHRAVADIDGSGSTGIYSYQFVACNSDSSTRTVTHGQFQLAGWELDDMGDSTGIAANNTSDALDSLGFVIDSLYAILDTLQNHDDWVGNFRYSNSDSSLTLKQVTISGANGVDGSFYVANSTGPGVKFKATALNSDGHGLYLEGNGAAGLKAFAPNDHGTEFVSGNTNGLSLVGGGLASDLEADFADSIFAVLDTLQNQDDWIGNVRYSHVDSTLSLRGLIVTAGGTDSSAVYLTGNGVGAGLRVVGGAGNGTGMYIDGGGGNSNGLSMAGSGTGDGLRAVGGTTGDGADFRGGTTSGHGIVSWAQGSGNGIRAIGDDDSAGAVFLGNGSGVGLYAEGGVTGDGLYATGGMTSGSGLVGVGIGATGTYKDLKVTNIDSGAFQATVSGLAAGVWGYGGGREIDGGYVDSNKTEQGGISGGDKNLTIFTVDTSGVDDTLDGVFITLQNATGVVKAVLSTNSSGVAEAVVSGGTWNVLASRYGFEFPDTSYVITANDTVGLLGYDIAIPSPSASETCRVYGFLYDLNSQPESGVTISAYLPSGVSRSGSLIVSPFSVATTSDSEGYFFLDLIKSTSLIPSGTEYEITISRRDGTLLRRRVVVPDQSTWQLTW